MSRDRCSMFFAALALTLMAVEAPLATQQSKTTVSQSVETRWSYDGREISYELTTEDFAATPRWSDPSRELPPLGMSEAIVISEEVLPRYVPEVSEWVLSSVTFKRFGRSDQWYYVVGWQAAGAGATHELNVPVLMNGRAIVLRWDVETPPEP